MRPIPLRRSKQRGFALIEVMSAMVLTAIFVMGLSGLWALAASQTRDLTLRQKAIYALNGEMERLTALYSMTNFGSSSLLSVLGLSWNSASGLYPPSVANFMPSSADDFATQDTNAFSGSDFLVLYVTKYQGQARNFVWVDRSQRMMGMMSWTESAITGSNCWSFSGGALGEPCRKVVLNFEYPYQLQTDGSITKLSNRIKNFSLSTIVGRRR